VLDRYTPSNVAYQGARVGDGLERFAEWLARVEHDVFGVPQPDLVVLLDVPVAVAVAGIAGRGRDDIHERRADYLARVAAVYRSLAARDMHRWRTVRCSDDGRTLLPRERIHERVWGALAPALAAYSSSDE
jgi:dTMP kinase